MQITARIERYADQGRCVAHSEGRVVFVRFALPGELVRIELDEPHERKDVDQVRVACKGGKALVGRIAVAGRAERAHLPVAVAAGFQEIQETLDGAGFEGADALVSRQASGVEKDAAAAFGQPVEQGESRC